jgi:hypothetical protein
MPRPKGHHRIYGLSYPPVDFHFYLRINAFYPPPFFIRFDRDTFFPFSPVCQQKSYPNLLPHAPSPFPVWGRGKGKKFTFSYQGSDWG